MFSSPPTCRERSGHSEALHRALVPQSRGRDTVGRTCHSCLTDDKGSDQSRGGRRWNETSQEDPWDLGSERIRGVGEREASARFYWAIG